MTKEQEKEHLRDLERIANFRLLDDDYMTKFFEKQPECVELVLQIIMDDYTIKVEKEMSQTQYVVKNLQGKSIRMDIRAVDTANNEYDLEVQRADSGAGARRARHNGSLMDANCVDAGKYGSKLPETYVIFVTENDVWKKGRPIYKIERYVDRELPFNDGLHIIYVNGAYEDDGTPIGKLMHDFRCKDAKDMHYEKLKNRTKHLKQTKKGVQNMCKAIEEMKKEVERKARKKTMKAVVLRLLKKKKTASEIVDLLDYPPSFVAKVARKNGYSAA